MATPTLKLQSPRIAQAERPHALFINRDISLVEFYRRVLGEALDRSKPLLERVRFLSIFSSLIDEFFMIRYSGLRDKAWAKSEMSPDGMTAAEQLAFIQRSVAEMSETQLTCLKEDILPLLADEGISLMPYASLTEAEQRHLREYFRSEIHPVLTPQAVDPSHPFPYIAGGTLNIGLYIRPKLNPRTERALQLKSDELFVRMKLPSFISRLIPVPGRADSFVLLEELVAANIDMPVSEAHTKACYMFRITRDADLELHETEAADLLELMEQNLRMRRFGSVVRLEVSSDMPDEMVRYLAEELQIDERETYRVNGPLGLGDMSALTKINRPELKDRPLKPVVPEILDSGRSKFELIKQGDIMLHHPYMPYSIITDFIAEAAEDPDVLAIKMCLYRLGTESPIPPLLIRASELGKQVTVLIELKARFDECNNIGWAKKLEEAGVHVIYGILGLKTHAKNTLIVRRENGKLRRYVHAATGNYNPQTSASYTDLGLLTADPQIGEDVSELFNFLTVYSQPREFKKLLVAPLNLRPSMLDLIRRETENAQQGKPARIITKLNRLADSEIVNALYEASSAGVQIDLIVRGICTLRPGVPGVSENIRVRSIVGRLLEHSRVYYFENGGEHEIYMGSSDWMPRNLDRRVEILTPIESEPIREYLKKYFLPIYLTDNTNAYILSADGSYVKVERRDDEEEVNCQEAFESDLRLFSGEETESA